MLIQLYKRHTLPEISPVSSFQFLAALFASTCTECSNCYRYGDQQDHTKDHTHNNANGGTDIVIAALSGGARTRPSHLTLAFVITEGGDRNGTRPVCSQQLGLEDDGRSRGHPLPEVAQETQRGDLRGPEDGGPVGDSLGGGRKATESSVDDFVGLEVALAASLQFVGHAPGDFSGFGQWIVTLAK